ncbi:aminotransferase class I/II-fold pyridoxal phosphate-dependent enzyme [Pseudomonas sp. NPDC007930]|uniref:MocR-like pyridoxine biosynthesis transcription factor PdxR n=1 Tax=Pseudomonas sp. NPDC007930 TaxID=3364417 RepID=UPI0036E94811
MELHIVFEGRKGLAQQLYAQLHAAIREGRLPDGTQLPPTRLLAEQLGVSRKTVADAYAQLGYSGLLEGQVGRGSFVKVPPAAAPTPRAAQALSGQPRLAWWQRLQVPLRHPDHAGRLRYEFMGGAVMKQHFPLDAWRQCMQAALRQMSEARGFYGDPQGVAALRAAVAGHAAFARGVRCTANDVLVCNGAQQALDLLARLLIEPGCRVAMEDPGYTPARLLFESLGASVVGVPVDAEGLCTEQVPEDARLVYVTPSHQMPLGMPMSPARRRALLALAEARGMLIIEDDYDSEFRYEGPALESLQSQDTAGVVAYVGTFSKTVLPELRLGYLVLPPLLMEPAIKARQLMDWHSNSLLQWALARFIEAGHLQRHIRRCHGIYASRRARILARAHSDLAPWLEPVPAQAGFHLALLLRDRRDAGALASAARAEGLGLYPLAGFYHQAPARQGLLMGFGSIERLDIDPALNILQQLLAR